MLAMAKISEFQVKDIINMADGKKLGNISDLEINVQTGKIEAIIVSSSGKLLGLFNKEDLITIPWKKIKKIGADVILVEYSSGDQSFLEDKLVDR